MKNLERWENYLKDVVSPDSYIRWGFFSLIACALQRRVFKGNLDIDPLFPNMYVIFVGEPGIGKGRVTSQVEKILRFHKKDHKQGDDDPFSKPEKISDDNKLKGDVPLLIPVGANATTYEALVSAMSNSVRSLYYQASPTQKRLYIHSSMCFCLSEIASLFRKKMEDLVRFLHETYDCVNYTYDTKHQGKDIIRSSCLNLLGGTQPSFLKTVFEDELLNEGFASRTVFICADGPRFRTMRSVSCNDEQLEGYKIIVEHVKKLSTLFGEVKFSDEALKFLEEWWQNEEALTVNKNVRLKHYYARKNITVMKLAMVIHFCDNLDLTVSLDECKQAILELEKVEVTMHGAVTPNSKNALVEVTELVLKFLDKNGPTTGPGLMAEFWHMLPEQDTSFKKIMEFLAKTGKIKIVDGSKYKKV